MALDIYNTHTMLMAIEQIPSAPSFLKDRYFPTNDATDIFATNDVLVEYKDGDRKLAPFVAPRKGGVLMRRNGYNTERFTPPTIAPRRTITIDDLKKKGFGEAYFSTMTPAQRENALALKDAAELGDAITRREEAMAAETLLTNACVMKHIADDATKDDEMRIDFYGGAENKAIYTPSKKWNTDDAQILDDLEAAADMLTSQGLDASDFVCSKDVAKMILNNTKVQKLLDNRRYELGRVKPEELTNGATLVCELNINGVFISVLSYNAYYTGDDGQKKLYIPSGKGVLTAPGAGKTIYGAVTQLESDKNFHTYGNRRVPKYIANEDNNVRELQITSCPLCIPKHKNAFIAMDVI